MSWGGGGDSSGDLLLCWLPRARQILDKTKDGSQTSTGTNCNLKSTKAWNCASCPTPHHRGQDYPNCHKDANQVCPPPHHPPSFPLLKYCDKPNED